ncbi:phage tail tube protein [Nocardiopsis lucentensis]|uniref:phage tail tube protein n=1 Tax=Nocardiopsis lucentensis TaxID=53441 RepID=UPI00034AD85D|nr:phage tail tube protein [Nocardiopsis lucentensis]
MAGFNAFGSQFYRGDGGSPETFDLVGEATDISGPEMSRDTIEVTSHDSPDAFREWVGGLKDGGEVTFTVRYDPDLHNPLQDDFDDEQTRNYQIRLPDVPGGIWNFSAFITNMGLSFPMEDAMGADFTFKISGKPTFEEVS